MRMFGCPVSIRYYAGLAMRIVMIAALVLLTVEVVFLSDIIVSRILPELLAIDATVFTIAQVIVYSSPAGIFIALPTAILIGVYFVLLRRREDQEFIVSASLGHDMKPLLTVALVAGLAGAFISLAVSGFVEPLARYKFRVAVSSAAQEAVQDGKLVANRFYSIGGATLYASEGKLSDEAKDVFIHIRKTPDTNRVILAKQTTNPKLNNEGGVGLIFVNAHVYEFADPGSMPDGDTNQQPDANACADCEGGDVPFSMTHMSFSNFYSQLPPLELLKPSRRGGPQEATLTELAFSPSMDRGTVQAIAERVTRAALCLVAPFLGMLALALTFPSTLLLALPATAGAILGLSFFNSELISMASHFGPGIMALSILLVYALVLFGCIVAIRTFRANLTRSIGVTL